MDNNSIINTPTKKEKLTIRLLILLGLLSIINFFYWFLKPELVDNRLLYWLLIGPLVFDSLRIMYIWYHYWNISVPKKPKFTKKPTVDVLTTYFPGEPYDMIKNTLLAIQKIKYPHTTYLCDEGNDEYLKAFCNEHGIKHVTRNNRINAKAGNINNALLQATGEICLILDPDHVPSDNFLDEIIPYFEDEKIGFVQAVQSYYNVEESSVAKGAAEQTFHFYGPIMMTMNSYGTVNAIGANCCFRRKALDSIGGHAPGLSEDMHTAMQLYAKGWKSVYVPRISTKGLVPSSLTAYYKQQLKWSRGTLELLVSVYPKLVKNFTWRQKIHFGILPLFYLSGIFFLISFLIPIISLFFATTPWHGNVIKFGLIFLPLFTSILGIRFYIQRWVTDKSERGTHIIGGVLLSCTWWIYITGLFYTIIRKKVPYLPTPKDDKEVTSWKILLPNLIIGIVSVIAVIYGLSIDFTPFSILMSGFALLNASFMFYTLFFAYQKQKPVKLSFDKTTGKDSILDKVQNIAYSFWHKAALPIVILLFIIFGSFHYKTEFVKWGGVKPEIQNKNIINYIGVFAPQVDNGITSLNNVKAVSKQIGEKFDIVSLYIAWDKNINSNFPGQLLDSIYLQKSIPMITWEPWLTSFDEDLGEKHVFDLISDGFFDDYITEFAVKLKNLEHPVFLRFAHEFDNPFYPWYLNDTDASTKFKNAWIHTYEIFKKSNAENVIWIWNPWKSTNVMSFYPGREYVDWIGVNILNYGRYNDDKKWHDFKSLYEPFHEEFMNLPATPVIITEFGSLKNEENQQDWIENAFSSIENEFNEIKSVIYFNSKVDNNWPAGLQKNVNLDWTVSESQLIKNSFKNKNVPDYVFSTLPNLGKSELLNSRETRKDLLGIKGINLNIGHDWRKDYRVLDRRKLLSDLKKIKRLGINTIKFQGNTIYSYNVLNTTEELGLKVSYGFWIPAYLDFVNDTVETKKLKEKIIRKVKRNKSYNHINSWNIQNDVLYNEKDFYHKPELFFQNQAYISWLKMLVEDISKIDSVRPVIIDFEVNKQLSYNTRLIEKNIMGNIIIGLVVKDQKNLDFQFEDFEKTNKNYLFSEIDVNSLVLPGIFSEKNSFFITSWQDVHESNKLTFNGLTDRKGRYRSDYYKLLNAIKDTNLTDSNHVFKAIKPAVALYPRQIKDYYAMVYDFDTGWRYGEVMPNVNFEWSLVKCDKYGHLLAIKDVGNGAKLSLEIPRDPDYFKLLLTAINRDTIYTSITSLKTPLLPKKEIDF